jgi:amino acid permease
MSTDDELFTPAEVLGGFSARRARLLLFQIESRTAYLKMQSRRAVERYLTEEAVEQQDLAFFEALVQGHELTVRPTIRDLERYALQWQSLVPPNVTLQATLASLLGHKYRFAQRDIPYIRRALGLDSEEVQHAFERQYQQPLGTIYTERESSIEWVRWRWNMLSGWLENLSPFWTAYALTFTEMVGASILALPIALAGVGPLPGVIILLVMGVFNVFTIAAMAEAVTRNGSIRYQGNYLGRLVHDYLGSLGSITLSTILLIDGCLAVVAYSIGFSLTLADATPVRAEVWAGVLFLLGMYFVRRKNLQTTVSSALLVSAISLSVILILSVLALGHLRMENLLYVHVPFLNGHPFEPALLGLIFGVVFAAYFGHLSVSSCARTVLSRDPGGRSLVWGCIAAQVSAMVLYILWVVAVNGAIAPQALTGFSGTALTPLAHLAGPAVNVLGMLLAVLAMGMASIHLSLALFFTVREWIPSHSRHTLALGRRQGTLICTPHGKAMFSLALTYLGLKGTQAQFRVDIQLEGETRRFEIAVTDTWEAFTALAELSPTIPPTSRDLTLQVVSASADVVRVQLVASMRIRYEGKWDTLGFDLLEMAETTDAAFVGWLAGREQTSVQEAADFLEQTELATRSRLKQLVEQGTLSETRENGQTWYRVHFSARRRREATTAIWQALDDSREEDARKQEATHTTQKEMRFKRVTALLQGETARSWLGISPLLLIFLLSEWLLVQKLESFSQLWGFLGVVAVPVEIGIFPALLLFASRRKGEHVPKFFLPFLAHPLVIGTIYLVSVGILFLHGLFIWQDTFQRGVALLVGGFMLAATYLMARQGTFARRLVIEVRQDSTEEGTGTFTVTDGGRAATQASVKLGYTDEERVYQTPSGAITEFPELCSATIYLPGTKAQELSVWLHRVTAEGQSENLPALLRVSSGKVIREFHMDQASKPLVLPLGNGGKKERGGRAAELGQLEIEVQLAENTTHKK